MIWPSAEIFSPRVVRVTATSSSSVTWGFFFWMFLRYSVRGGRSKGSFGREGAGLAPSSFVGEEMVSGDIASDGRRFSSPSSSESNSSSSGSNSSRSCRHWKTHVSSPPAVYRKCPPSLNRTLLTGPAWPRWAEYRFLEPTTG